MLFSWLTEKGILAMNPAREAKRRSFIAPKAKRRPSIPTKCKRFWIKLTQATKSAFVIALCWAHYPYTFARIGALVNLKVEDYFQTGKRSMIRFREKGGKENGDPGAPQTGGAS